ncbi:MAG TPA: hypothetical protein VGK99_13070 [Acidobacteriota bacterium]
MLRDQEKSPDTYTTWMGKPVFLNLTAGGIKTTLFCTIIGESNSTVRVRIGNQWDVDIYKEMILLVDALPHTDGILARENPKGPIREYESNHVSATADTSPGPQ